MKSMKDSKLEKIEGGVTAAKGFQAAGINCGIKESKLDLAIIYSETEAAAAGVFTQNVFKAAPVTVSQEHLALGSAQGIVINSGNANACTGKQGLTDAQEMAVVAGDALKLEAHQVVVASTGVIGVSLPMDKIASGIEKAAKVIFLSEGSTPERGGDAAAQAIMTTDTVSKQVAVKLEIDGVPVTVGGMAKGSGMIHPNMATMLAFITTDVAIAPTLLQQALLQCTRKSFNRITVDGDTSTNDMVVVLANGKAGNELISSENQPEYAVLLEALQLICTEMAQMIVRDGEGATKFIEIRVINCNSEKDAERIGKAIAGSSLFKTAMFGEDANWGRIVAAAGYSGAQFDPAKVNIWMESPTGKIQTTANGEGLAFNEAKAKEILKEKDIILVVDLQQGNYGSIVWTCDLSYEYVRINADYRS